MVLLLMKSKSMSIIKPYTKVVTDSCAFALAAVYEPHPFRPSAIKSAFNNKYIGNINTGVADSEWCWVYYDWCGNPVATSAEFPSGKVVDEFKAEDLMNSQPLADYLNKKPLLK